MSEGKLKEIFLYLQEHAVASAPQWIAVSHDSLMAASRILEEAKADFKKRLNITCPLSSYLLLLKEDIANASTMHNTTSLEDNVKMVEFFLHWFGDDK